MEGTNTRNSALDCAKGVAIILVCLGHILQATTCDYYDSPIYNVIYAVQMPVFFLISGILSTNKIETFEQLSKKVCKRAQVYLIPFVSRIFVFNTIFSIKPGTFFEKISGIVFSIDSGLWFLWVLFILCINCDIAVFITKSIRNKKNKFVLQSGIYFALLFPWAIGLFVFKTNYLGAKLIIYYSLFYFLGRVLNDLSNIRWLKDKRIKELGLAISFCIGLYITSHHRLLIDIDSIEIIILRVLSGISLSFVFLHFINRYTDQLSKIGLNTLGKYTLEIYYVHGLAVSLLAGERLPKCYSLEGTMTVLASIILTIVITYVVIVCIKSNRVLNFIFFGKIK